MFGTCDTKRGAQRLRGAVMLILLAAAIVAVVLRLITGGEDATGTITSRTGRGDAAAPGGRDSAALRSHREDGKARTIVTRHGESRHDDRRRS